MKCVKPVLAALAILVSACAADSPRTAAPRAKPDWKNPNIHVVDDRHLIVDQEPIVVPKGRKDDITFHLEPQAGHKFAGEGIVIDAPKTVYDCRVQAGDERVKCKNFNPGPGRYKYTIRVKTPSGKVLESDPFIMND